MIAKLIDWCIHNRILVMLLTLALIVAGVWAMFTIKLDAIPDLSDVQVIVSVEYPGQSPQIVEDQVTTPLTRAMLAVPKARVVRGYSLFGTSFVYVIFEDGTDIYWARSRVQEFMNSVSLPAGVERKLGPDATGVGWIFEYVLTTGKYCPEHPNGLWQDPQTEKWYAGPDDAPAAMRGRLVHHRVFPDSMTSCPLDGMELQASKQDLANLRSIQDWYLRYELKPVEGVSEVASLGGFEKQYQVTVDPVKLLAYNIPLSAVRSAVERSNQNVGGRVLEFSEREYAVQGLGYLGTLSDAEMAAAKAAGKSVEEARTEKVQHDLRRVSLGVTKDGTPIYLADVADVRIGPDMRRGVLEWNGQGETVGGIVVMRFGENARTTIQNVRKKLADVEKGLPPGVAVEVSYDRSDLIDRAVNTLSNTLIEEIVVVALVCIFFLLHARSELVAVFVVPTGVLASILIMHLMGINANIMSLGGIAIAIGVMVDSSIVMVENSHKHLDREEERMHALIAAGLPATPRPRTVIIAEAAKEVGPSLFFALLTLTVSFLPVFVLGDQSGRLFKPLAYTKTFAMFASSLLAVTIIPVLMSLFITARVLPKEWGWLKNLFVTLAVMVVPAMLILVIPLPRYDEYRHWFALAWFVLAGMLLVPQKIIHENVNPISKIQQWAYQPLFVMAMRFRWSVMALALLAVLSIALPYFGLRALPFGDKVADAYPKLAEKFPGMGSEFMPPLEEGDLLYMPTTVPGISTSKARELLQQTDRMILLVPEVQSVMGKAGRADTATDPAPLNMLETTITLKRDKSKWRHVPIDRFYSSWPGWAGWLPKKIWSDTRPITVDELIYGYDLPDGQHMPGLQEIVNVPGLRNSWTMPIRTRIDMLSTGIKTPVGIKVMGPDLATLAGISEQIARTITKDPRTGPHTTSAFADKPLGGSYLDIVPNDQIGRYGLVSGDLTDVISTALGGQTVTKTVEGLERYTVNVRYPQELRDSIDKLQQTLVNTPAQGQVPLGQLATFRIHDGPDMIRSENARLTNWIYVDISNVDVGTYVDNARKAVEANVALPAGYSIVWAGQYQYMQETNDRLSKVIPFTLLVIVMLLYLSSRSWLRVCIVLLAVPFSLVGAFWLLWALDYSMSTAVWVGLIALAGLDAETGTVMLLYLDNSFARFKAEGRMRNSDDLWHAVHDGAVKRIRPKTMTVATAFIGLLPLLWASGAGADTMRRLAAPMIGGLVTSFIMELLIYPAIYYTARKISMRGRQ